MKFILKSALAGIAVVTLATAAWAEGKVVRIASHVGELAPLIAQANLFAEKVEERLPGQFDFPGLSGRPAG